MSRALLNFVEQYLTSKTDTSAFVNQYIDQWKKERDTNISLADDPFTSETLSSVFCLTDMFNPEPDRDSDELDEAGLRAALEKLLTRQNDINSPIS
jgi:hypothetical protein